MAKTVQQKKFRWQAHKPLLATALAVAGVFNMMSAVVAEGTAAGETISNTATATYTDDDGSVINATSNTVEILVAEVAGLTAVPVGINDTDDGAVEDGDILEFFFEVTNTGNAETNVNVPGIDGLNANTTDNFDATTVEIVSIDDNGTPGDPSDDVVTVLQAIDPAGSTTTTPLPADGSIIVRVTGTPAAGTSAGDLVSVTLGNVAPNDNSAATQNQDFAADGNNDDLFTVDSDPTLAPENGQREASAQQDISFASSVNPLALATALKTSTLTTNDPSVTTDDQITYDLGLRVEDTDPTNVFQPAALVGTTLNVDGVDEELILVSDAIPEGTVFESITQPIPTGWDAVYSTVAPTGVDPLSATASWSRTQPTDLATIERVGFVRTGSLAPGFEQTGLLFTVRTNGLPEAGGVVDNIAQVFGETSGVPDAVIYDESGDASPNNNTPPTDGTNYPAGGDDGVADADVDGVDAGNNNTGDPDDTDGEVNQQAIVPSADDILNGPSGTPGAVGPTDDNDDFTNNSTDVPAGLEEGDLFDPSGDPVSFTNTVSNPTAGTLSNVTIEPIAPSQAAANDGNDLTDSQYGLDGDIPDGTIVTISYDDGVNAVQTATYTYTDGAAEPFALTTGTPVNVGDILPGAAPIDYDVTVTLPDGTNGTDPVAVLDEIPIPIVAFADDDPTNNAGFTGEVTNNITIDRVYTGFMSLVKTARVLDVDGNEIVPFTQDLSTENIEPGEYIEYMIDYLNISTDGTAGTGNVGMSANNFVITEDGTIGFGPDGVAGTADDVPGNNWAGFTTHQQNTAATTGDIELTGDGTTYTVDPSSGTVVDVYTNDVGTVLPQGSGSLTFRRLVD